MEKIVEYRDFVFSGNTWNGLRVGVTVNGESKDLTLTESKVAFRKGSTTGELMYVLTTPRDIEVDTNNKIFIKPIKIDFPAGLYVGDLEITDVNTTKTYLRIFLTVETTTNG